MKWVRRVALAVGILMLVAVVSLLGLGLVLHRPLPEATPSAEADAVARQMLASVDAEAWARTGAVRWSLAGRRSHLWDRTRGLHRLEHGDLIVVYDLDSRRGRAWRGGEELEGAALERAIEDAWSAFCNDSFWLNPVVKAFDEGTTRSLVALPDGGPGLLVSYASGGVTPGDSYLWTLDEQGRPTHWRMWVSILPVGGLRASWEDWETLSTGAEVSTRHRWDLGLDLGVTDLAGAATLSELLAGEPDPFAVLFEG